MMPQALLAPSLVAPLALWAAFCLTYAGMAALSVAMVRHHEQLYGRLAASKVPLLRRCVLRLLGSGLLWMAWWACTLPDGGWRGLVLFCGLVSVASFALILLLAYWPRRAIWVGVVAGGIGVGGLITSCFIIV